MGFNALGLSPRVAQRSPGRTSMYLDFRDQIYVLGGWLYGSLPALGLTNSRSTPRTVLRNGTILDVLAGESAIGDNGLSVLGEATNLLLNSDTLSTQSVTVTAEAHTLSFYGAGTVTLSGASTAGPLVGTGASERVTLTFTPSAGSLTLTVSGSVLNGQLETGSAATAYIPTEGSAVTRGADGASVTIPNAATSILWKTPHGSMYTAAQGGQDWDFPQADTATLWAFDERPPSEDDPADLKYMIAYSQDTTVDNLQVDGMGNVDVLFIGANGVEHTETLSNGVQKDGIDLAAEGLTAPIAIVWPSSLESASLAIFYCFSNNLTGVIPDLSANTNLGRFYCNSNNLTGVIPDLSANTNLGRFYCNNNNLTGVAAGFAVAPSCTNFRAEHNQLTEAAVDAILAAFVAAGASNGTLKLEGSNSPPSASGLSDKSTLEGRGWTVTVAS